MNRVGSLVSIGPAQQFNVHLLFSLVAKCCQLYEQFLGLKISVTFVLLNTLCCFWTVPPWRLWCWVQSVHFLGYIFEHPTFPCGMLSVHLKAQREEMRIFVLYLSNSQSRSCFISTGWSKLTFWYWIGPDRLNSKILNFSWLFAYSDSVWVKLMFLSCAV